MAKSKLPFATKSPKGKTNNSGSTLTPVAKKGKKK